MEVGFIHQDDRWRRHFGDEIVQFILWRDARSGIVRITDVNESGIRDVGHLGEVVREAVSERNLNNLRSIDSGMVQNCFEGRISYDQFAALRSCESFRAQFQHLARPIAEQDLVGRDIVQLRQFLIPVSGGAAGCVIGTVFARERVGLTTAQAAPAPNSSANFRREIETVFM